MLIELMEIGAGRTHLSGGRSGSRSQFGLRSSNFDLPIVFEIGVRHEIELTSIDF